jgi:monoamine oxidase
MSSDSEIIVVGAGAAGLSAALALARAGKQVTILEARDRLGGRMHTRNDGVPIELGAEFIHGFAPEIFEPLQQNGIPIEEVSGRPWCQRDGQICSCDFFEEVDHILSAISDQGPDEPFSTWLERKFPNSGNDPRLEEAKRNATRYVVGFNAADADKVSLHWLAHNALADQKIDGERAFRMAGGYATFVELFRKQLAAAGVSIQLNSVVERIKWSLEGVHLALRTGDNLQELRTRRLLITVPLGVLQAKPGELGAIQFDPGLHPPKQDALTRLVMGKVIRVVIRFRERFWENIRPPNCKDSLANLGFLFSEDDRFPTWWTRMPEVTPVITGWAPAHYAEKLSGESDFMLMQESLESLSSVFKISKEELENLVAGFYSHDWQRDPFARGAYSYVRAGGEGEQAVLAAPVENTLFFAGEATDTSGHNGTVHGAIASGRRAANEILNRK